jgi:hypothetical protein
MLLAEMDSIRIHHPGSSVITTAGDPTATKRVILTITPPGVRVRFKGRKD